MRCEIGWPIGNRRWQVDQAGADVGGDLAHRAGQFAGRFQADVELADVDAFGMLVRVRAATAAPTWVTSGTP